MQQQQPNQEQQQSLEQAGASILAAWTNMHSAAAGLRAHPFERRQGLTSEAAAGLPQQGCIAGRPVTRAAHQRASQAAKRICSTSARVTRTEARQALGLLEKASKEQLEAVDWLGYMPLHIAASFGIEAAVDVLLAKGVNLEARTTAGSTPLLLAVWRGNADVVRKLLAHGAQVDTRDCQQCSPLHVAVRTGNATMLRLLLAAGADAAGVSRFMLGQGSDGRVAYSDSNSTAFQLGATPMHIAAYTGQVQLVQQLLAAGAAVDLVDGQGGTALFWACFSGHVKVVGLLLARGAAVGSAGPGGLSPLRLRLRLQHGPSKGAPVRSQPRLHGQKYWNLVHQK